MTFPYKGITWVSLETFMRMTPQQRARLNVGIDLSAPSSMRLAREDQLDHDEERADGWCVP